jgi:ATP-dependent DNA helicase DinG
MIIAKTVKEKVLVPKLTRVRFPKEDQRSEVAKSKSETESEVVLEPVEQKTTKPKKRKVKQNIEIKDDNTKFKNKTTRSGYDRGYFTAQPPTGKLIDYFPEGFAPRPAQIHILDELDKCIKAGIKYVIVDAPTGIGKSLLAMAVARYFGNCYICTAQKSLQDQYLRDFSHMAVTVKGRNAFECLEYDPRRDGMINDCDHGWCKNQKKNKKGKKSRDSEDETEKCPRNTGGDSITHFAYYSASRGDVFYLHDPSETSPCLYQNQKATALNSPIVITNYDYLLAATNYSTDFGIRRVMISDEGHGLEGKIAGFFTVEITQRTLDKINALGVTPNETGFPMVHANASQQAKFDTYIEYMKDLDTLVKVILTLDLDIEDTKTFENIAKKLGFLMEDVVANKKNWIVKEERNFKTRELSKIQFCPVMIDKYAKDVFFKFGKDFNLIMSATILAEDKEACNKFAEDLGIKPEEFAYITVPQVFPPKNNLLFNLMTTNMGYNPHLTVEQKYKFYRDLTDKVDLILDLHPNVKGIIHCHTNELAAYIGQYTRHSDRIITHNTKNRIEKLKEHCHPNNKRPTVLCSPSLYEGTDLKDDLSRFQIVIKIPFPSTQDERIKKRLECDKEFLHRLAVLSFAQSLGRSVRSEKDFARTYTIDTRFPWFINHNKPFLGNLLKDRVIPNPEQYLRAVHKSKKEQEIFDELFKRKG